MAIEDAVHILLVEDNPIDARATIKAAAKLKIANVIDHVDSGEAALEYLQRDRSVGPRPDLVLLDLNLPGKDGKDVLSEMKAHPELCTIPVVVLTTSDDEADILGAYSLGANAYVTKPVGLAGWIEVTSRIESFWFELVKLPPK